MYVISIYQSSAMYASLFIGLTRTCPSIRHLGSFSDKNKVSLVPKLIAMSFLFKHKPTKDAGLSPVNDITRHSELNPNRST